MKAKNVVPPGAFPPIMANQTPAALAQQRVLARRKKKSRKALKVARARAKLLNKKQKKIKGEQKAKWFGEGANHDFE